MHDVYVPAEGVLTAELDGEAVVLNTDTKAYHRLNETGAFIWSRLEAGESADRIVTALGETFEVDATEARAALERLLGALRDRGLVVPEADPG
jgi:hypothetical protein